MSDLITSEIKFEIELDSNRVPEKLFGLQKMAVLQKRKQKLLCCLFGIVKPKKRCE